MTSDEFNRNISLTYGAYTISAADEIRMYGFGFQPATYKVRWTGVTVSQNYSTQPNPLIASNTPHVAQPYENGIIPLSVGWLGVSEIELPTQAGSQKYLFSYNGAGSGLWGQLTSATLPTGARADYQYRIDGYGTTPPILSGNSDTGYSRVLNDAPKQKTLTWHATYDGQTQTVVDTWSFTPTSPINTYPITGTTAPDGGMTGENFTFFDYNPSSIQRPDGTVIERVWKQNIPKGATNYTGQRTNPYVATEFISIRNAAGSLAKTAIKDYKYDKNGNLTQVVEYDWIAYSGPYVDTTQGTALTTLPAGLTPKRVTINEWSLLTPDASDSATDDPNVYHKSTAPRLLRAVKATEVRSDFSDTTALSRKEFYYDNATMTGNLSEQRSWDSRKNKAYTDPDAGITRPLGASNSISIFYQFGTWLNGPTGKLTQMTDANGNVTDYFYDDIGNGTIDMYVTKTIAANGTGVKRTSEFKYDYWTGLVTESKDTDNLVSTLSTYDVFGRPTLVREAANTTVERKTVTQYADVDRRVIIQSDKDATGDGKHISIKHYDELGRVRLARTLESGNILDATDETLGIKVQTRYFTGSTSYPNVYQLISAPYRATTSSGAGSETGMGWTRTKSDQAGKTLEVETFSGTTLPAPWATGAISSGKVTTAYDAEATTATDQAKKVRRSLIDGLGRLIRVDEPIRDFNTGETDPNLILGAPSSPGTP